MQTFINLRNHATTPNTKEERKMSSILQYERAQLALYRGNEELKAKTYSRIEDITLAYRARFDK